MPLNQLRSFIQLYPQRRTWSVLLFIRIQSAQINKVWLTRINYKFGLSISRSRIPIYLFGVSVDLVRVRSSYLSPQHLLAIVGDFTVKHTRQIHGVQWLYAINYFQSCHACLHVNLHTYLSVLSKAYALAPNQTNGAIQVGQSLRVAPHHPTSSRHVGPQFHSHLGFLASTSFLSTGRKAISCSGFMHSTNLSKTQS